MRVIDRLSKYMAIKKISAYTFERRCRIANGYLKKQENGKGSIGSDIIERIHKEYLDLSLLWLIAGEGEMLIEVPTLNLLQEERIYYSKDDKLRFLTERTELLEQSLTDKEKIIALLEAELKKKNL